MKFNKPDRKYWQLSMQSNKHQPYSS